MFVTFLVCPVSPGCSARPQWARSAHLHEVCRMCKHLQFQHCPQGRLVSQLMAVMMTCPSLRCCHSAASTTRQLEQGRAPDEKCTCQTSSCLDVPGTDTDKSGASGPAHLWNGKVELADDDRRGAGTATGTVTCGWMPTLRLIWVKRLTVEC